MAFRDLIVHHPLAVGVCQRTPFTDGQTEGVGVTLDSADELLLAAELRQEHDVHLEVTSGELHDPVHLRAEDARQCLCSHDPPPRAGR